jgi:hypothetical protein
MRRTTLLLSTLLVTLAACSEPPKVSATVTDIWGRPVDGATVRLEGVTEQGTTDAAGLHVFTSSPGTHKVEAGKKGWIKAGAKVTIDENTKAPAEVRIELHKEPPRPGFYAVDHNKKDYTHLEASAIEVLGSEVGAYIGIVDEKDAELRGDKAVQFVFSSTAKATELSRLGLQLHRLEFIPKEQVTGVLGDQDVAVNMWVAKDPVEYDMVGLPSDDDYLIKVRGKLPKGTYAFHTEGVLTSKDKDALERTPKEMRVAYPFTVK